MRPFHNAISAATVVLLLAGCTGDDAEDALEGSATVDAEESADGAATTDDGAASGEAEEPRTFAAGDDIPVTLSLIASEDGGRQTGIFGGYRGEVTFADRDPLTCSVGGPAEGGAIEPGETHDVALTCPEDVTLEPGEDELLVVEGGREVATGTVLPAGHPNG